MLYNYHVQETDCNQKPEEICHFVGDVKSLKLGETEVAEKIKDYDQFLTVSLHEDESEYKRESEL